MEANFSIELNSSWLDKTKALINNEDLSDSCFLVGESKEDQQKIYGHKFMLSIDSPVFKSMFYGSLAEKKELIEIPDLTPVGFMNMIRYVYGEKIRLGLHELFETYMAANKYMVNNLCDDIRRRLLDNLNDENRILIYDQLIKLKMVDESIDDEMLDDVRSMINESAFSNGHFNKICEDTLKDILNIKFLGVSEFVILKSCINWINGRKSTVEDKRTSFKSIRPYIHFSRIALDDLKAIDQIDSFLTNDEMLSLFLFLTYPETNPLPFEMKSNRQKLVSVYYDSYDYVCGKRTYYETLSNLLIVNHDIWLKSIETSLPSRLINLKIEFSLEIKILEQNFSIKIQNSKIVLVPSKCIAIKSNLKYLIRFFFNDSFCTKFFSKSVSDPSSEEVKVVFKLDSNIHCIEKINFFIIEEKK